MTVPPVQDLIVDVMAAADPAAQRVAASKLERLTPAANQNFAADVSQKIEAGGIEQSGKAAAATKAADVLNGGAGHAAIVNTASGNSPYRKFEAFVLQTFVESMLPKDSEELFGKGTAGTVWRSMLAEQISNEMAKGDGVGIAKQLAKSRAAAKNAKAEG